MRGLVTGSCGLVGYSACKRLLAEGWSIVGLDNDSRAKFFGLKGSTGTLAKNLSCDPKYTHHTLDIRDAEVHNLLRDGIDLVIHCAAQPSHDWATNHVLEDFQINALGTLNLLEGCRHYCPRAPFIHVSTSKVYGDGPNALPLEERSTRLELPEGHILWEGIPETFPIDQCLHSFFGVSKLAGDLLAQEYGRHLGMPVGVFRPGCVTGGHQRGVELHGFLQYLMSCVKSGRHYRVYGYQGKQVRCNVHSDDLVDAFLLFAASPRSGAVYNVGGRGLDCSLNEAAASCAKLCGREPLLEYIPQPRRGDHRWWISDASTLRKEYGWKPKRGLSDILNEIYDGCSGVAQC